MSKKIICKKANGTNIHISETGNLLSSKKVITCNILLAVRKIGIILFWLEMYFIGCFQVITMSTKKKNDKISYIRPIKAMNSWMNAQMSLNVTVFGWISLV
jgi:hypothetical protein